MVDGVAQEFFGRSQPPALVELFPDGAEYGWPVDEQNLGYVAVGAATQEHGCGVVEPRERVVLARGVLGDFGGDIVVEPPRAGFCRVAAR